MNEDELLLEVMNKIRRIALCDINYKTRLELYLSLVEEYGELGTEIKIEQNVFCNSHKTIDEGSKGESVDLFICAAAMMYSIDPDIDIVNEKHPLINATGLSPILAFKLIGEYLPDINVNVYSCANVISLALYIHNLSNTSFEEFIAITHKKLDKWENHQLKELELANI